MSNPIITRFFCTPYDDSANLIVEARIAYCIYLTSYVCINRTCLVLAIPCVDRGAVLPLVSLSILGARRCCLVSRERQRQLEQDPHSHAGQWGRQHYCVPPQR